MCNVSDVGTSFNAITSPGLQRFLLDIYLASGFEVAGCSSDAAVAGAPEA
jgi:hypothetical protein